MLWKGMLEEVFDDFLRFVFPRVDEVLDMRRGFEFLDKELSEMYPEPDKPSQTRYVDKLVKVYQLDGKEEWILVHVEVQGYHDKLFPARMFEYYCRIVDRYRRPVTALAIFTGEDGKSMPDRYVRNFMGSELMYRYNTLYITDYCEEILAESNNPFALVILAAKKALLAGTILDLDLKDHKLMVVNLLYEKGLFSQEKIEAIMTFLNNSIVLEDPIINRIFIQQLDRITGKKNTMGINEQLAQIKSEEDREDGLLVGRTEGQQISSRLFVENLLKNTDFSLEKMASLANVNIDFVRAVKNTL